ncbi:related to vacuolar protein sorting-associated protein [Cephalotrichum gorgonifer]|uniref:Vacuolar protein sorting-associated protein 17 n=1 Tax=Cephalotrichum gorgonifer TaxID=2041049 RepID=A0AAE8N403_9PEZI|nr:related to vacuolar protein sorting-associated protein [Cephalotrichum gorgonifer]
MDYTADEPSPWGSPGPSPRRGGPERFGSPAEEPSQTPFAYNPSAESSTLSRPDTDESEENAFPQHDAAKAMTDDVFREQKARPETRDAPQPFAAPSDSTSPFASAPAQQQQAPPETPQKSQEQVRAMEHGQAAQDAQPAKPAAPQPKLQAKITGLERVGKKDPVLRFDVHTNLPRFRTTQYRDVRRLHSEFVKLAEHLISANPEALVPAVPPALTSAGAGTEEDEVRVKSSLQRWFNYVCASEVLMRDDEMVLFVESDFGYSPMVKRKQPATGVRRKILKQFAPPPDDTPELADARPIVKLFYLGTMDAGHKVDKMVKARRGLGLSEADFGVKLGGMNVQEPHVGLANAYRKLGKVVQAVGDYHAAQATAQATTIGDPFQYHSQDAFIVKETLTNRQILVREFLQAQETTRSRLNSADRLKASSTVRREKVDEAIAQLDEARAAETYLYQKTAAVTRSLVGEKRRWFDHTSADLRAAIRDFVVREIEAERRTLSLLESVRPDIRSIDGSGGLSRLGREAHPPVRRSNLTASQGPKGDAWSGVPRRTDAARTSSGDLEEVVGGIAGLTVGGVGDEDDEDKIDARNAASRLAASTF